MTGSSRPDPGRSWVAAVAARSPGLQEAADSRPPVAGPLRTGSTTSSADPPVRRFPIRVGRRSRPLLALFGVRRGNTYVDLEDTLDARFGFFRLTTPVPNIS